MIKMILELGMLCKASTWKTTAICADARYITLCSIAGTGDPVGLVEKGATKAAIFHPYKAKREPYLLDDDRYPLTVSDLATLQLFERYLDRVDVNVNFQ